MLLVFTYYFFLLVDRNLFMHVYFLPWFDQDFFCINYSLMTWSMVIIVVVKKIMAHTANIMSGNETKQRICRIGVNQITLCSVQILQGSRQDIVGLGIGFHFLVLVQLHVTISVNLWNGSHFRALHFLLNEQSLGKQS